MKKKVKKMMLSFLVGAVFGLSCGILLTVPFAMRDKKDKEFWKAKAESFYKTFKDQNTLLKRCEKIMNKDNVIIMRNYE